MNNINSGEKKFWFPAKRYGWGWGPPHCWQGWVVIVAWVGLLMAGTYAFRPDRHMGLFLGYTGVMCVCLVVICWLKGEKPGWRWGDK